MIMLTDNTLSGSTVIMTGLENLLGLNTTGSKGYYEYTKKYLQLNWFSPDKAYNVAVTINRYYMEIQKTRELTATENSNMEELSLLVEARTTEDTAKATQPKVAPAPVDYGGLIPAPILNPLFNPMLALSNEIAKYKWLIIGIGGLAVLYAGSTIYHRLKEK
jgi:hypothetical protein